MPTTDLTGTTALVTGASRGFGRGIARELAAHGAQVIGLARRSGPLGELQELIGDRFTPVVGDATDQDLAHALLVEHQPRTLVLNAGAVPSMGPLQDQTWETFSTNWHVDTRQAFGWTCEALRLPLPPGSVVISVSSGSALRGSPMSGGYAGANSTVRFISAYAASESERGGLGLRFRTLFPQLTPTTGLGTVGVEWYAQRAGVSVATFLESAGPALTPEQVGNAVADLALEDGGPTLGEHLLTAAGVRVVEALG